jgi:hypothetical protein
MSNIERKAIVSKLLKLISSNQPVKGTYVKSIKPEDIFDAETPTTTLYPIKAGNSTILVPIVDPNDQQQPAINPNLAQKILNKVIDPKQKEILKNYITQTQKLDERENRNQLLAQTEIITEDIKKKTEQAQQEREIKKKEFEKKIYTPAEIKDTKIKNLEKANITKKALKEVEKNVTEDILNELMNKIYEEEKVKKQDIPTFKKVLSKEELDEKYPRNERAKLFQTFDTEYSTALKNNDTEKLKELKYSEVFQVYSKMSNKNEARKKIIKTLTNL